MNPRGSFGVGWRRSFGLGFGFGVGFRFDFGRGAAISILMLLIVAVLSVFYVRKMVRTSHEAT